MYERVALFVISIIAAGAIAAVAFCIQIQREDFQTVARMVLQPPPQVYDTGIALQDLPSKKK